MQTLPNDSPVVNGPQGKRAPARHGPGKFRPLPKPDPVPTEVDSNLGITGSVRKTASLMYRHTGGKHCFWTGKTEVAERHGIPLRTLQKHLKRLETLRVVRTFASLDEYREWHQRYGIPVYGLPWPKGLAHCRHVIMVLSHLPRPEGCTIVEHGGPQDGANEDVFPPLEGAQTAPLTSVHGAQTAPSTRRNGFVEGAQTAPSSFKGSKFESLNGTRAKDDSALASDGEAGNEATAPPPVEAEVIEPPAAPELAEAPFDWAAFRATLPGFKNHRSTPAGDQIPPESSPGDHPSGSSRGGRRVRWWASPRGDDPPPRPDPEPIDRLPPPPRPVAHRSDSPIEGSLAAIVARAAPSVAPAPGPDPTIPIRRPSDHVRNLPGDPDPGRPSAVARLIGLHPRFRDTKPVTMGLWAEAFARVQAGDLAADLVADLVDNATRKRARNPPRLLSTSLARELRRAKKDSLRPP